MKHVFFLLAFVFTFSAYLPTFAQSEGIEPETQDPPITTFEADNESLDLGEVEEGDLVSVTYTLTNTGENDLIIETAKPSCSCTVLEWTTEPVAPGKTATVYAEFETRGYIGENTKTMTVIYNGEPRIKRLKFSVNVIPIEYIAPPKEGGEPVDLMGGGKKKEGGSFEMDNTTSSPWDYK